MKNYKKVLAAALAMTMVAGSSVMAAAPGKSYVSGPNVDATTSSDASGTITGGGQMEGKVDEDVFHIVVPASVQGSSASFDGFNFVMDPQMLITETDAAKYVTGSNITADGFVRDKTLYFVNKTDRQLDNTSDYVRVTNKGSIDVDITLSAEMKNLGAITMSDTDKFADDSTSLYLAVIGGNVTKAIDETDGAEVTGTIPKANEDAYDTIYDDTAGDYEYKLVDDDEAHFSTYDFALTGATNAKGNWLNVTDTPSVEVTWKVEPADPSADAAPSITPTSVAKPSSGDLTFDVNLGSGSLAATSISKITFELNGETREVQSANYAFAGGKLTLKAAMLGNVTSTRTYTVTFNNGKTATLTITV